MNQALMVFDDGVVHVSKTSSVKLLFRFLHVLVRGGNAGKVALGALSTRSIEVNDRLAVIGSRFMTKRTRITE